MTTPAAARPVVVGIDGSDDSRTALRWATDEARRRAAPLWVVHALDGAEPGEEPAGARRAAEELLDAAVRQARESAAGVDVRPVLEVGSASIVLLKESTRAALVVLGARGRGGFTGLLLGSTPLQVASHAPCAVVVVRAAADDVPAGPSAGRVVVGADGSLHSEGALAFAFAMAQERGVGVTAVRAWHSPSVCIDFVPPHERQQAEKNQEVVLAETVAVWRERHPDVDVAERLVLGVPGKALIDESAGAELLVVGSHGRGGFGGLPLGSVSHTALHYAHCPIAVVRH